MVGPCSHVRRSSGSDAGTGGADAGSGGGVAAGCEGVVPDSLGSSFTFDVPFSLPRGDWSCDSDTSDESGNIASRVTYGTTYASQQWHLFDSNGAHQIGLYALGLFPQGSGFEGISEGGSGEVPSFKVSRWTPDGQRTDGAAVGGDIVPIAVRAWPNGLLTVLPGCHGPTSNAADFVLRRFDENLNELSRATAAFACAKFAGAVEDANQNKLLIVSGTGAGSWGFADDDLVGVWFDPAGAALTGWFRVGAGGAATHQWLAHALIGGGAAVRIDGAWTYFIPSGKAEAQPAPAFLAENGNADFTLVRGAKAYAVLPRSGDRTQLKLYSASGDLCGTVKFPAGGLTTGADGSVIASSGDRGCTKTVWPALLR